MKRYDVYRWAFLAGIICAVFVSTGAAVDDSAPKLTNDQMKHFLLTAKVVRSKQSGKGITHPLRLTLSDGVITHDAAFQMVDEHKPLLELANGHMEMNFVDSYKYNIAGFTL